MRAPAQPGSSQRTVTVLAVLFGLLLGGAGLARGTVETEARLSRGDQVQLSKNVARASARSESDDAQDPFLGASPPQPRIELVSLRPSASPVDTLTPAAIASRPLPYRARAPPTV